MPSARRSRGSPDVPGCFQVIGNVVGHVRFSLESRCGSLNVRCPGIIRDPFTGNPRPAPGHAGCVLAARPPGAAGGPHLGLLAAPGFRLAFPFPGLISVVSAPAPRPLVGRGEERERVGAREKSSVGMDPGIFLGLAGA